jgi:hypothetical protein
MEEFCLTIFVSL